MQRANAPMQGRVRCARSEEHRDEVYLEWRMQKAYKSAFGLID
jgi:hypothetical protein